MLSKLTKRSVGTWQHVPTVVLQRRRWWEVAVIAVCLMGSVAVLDWCLWRPVTKSDGNVVSRNVQLDVAALAHLTTWADEREKNKAASTVDERFNALFQ